MAFLHEISPRIPTNIGKKRRKDRYHPMQKSGQESQMHDQKTSPLAASWATPSPRSATLPFSLMYWLRRLQASSKLVRSCFRPSAISRSPNFWKASTKEFNSVVSSLPPPAPFLFIDGSPFQTRDSRVRTAVEN